MDWLRARPRQLGPLLILLRRRATAAESPYPFAILVNRHGPLSRQHASPRVAMMDWIPGESTANAPLSRPKPAEAAAFPWATVVLTALAPLHTVKSQEIPPSVAHGHA